MKLTSINGRGWVRLIPATYHKPPVLRGLVDTDEEAAILAELEGETSARLLAEQVGSPSLDRRELAFARRSNDLKVYGQSHINAAFAYTRPSGNRFNDGARGAWYCAYETLTAAEEVGYHRTRELQNIGIFEDEALYVELLADFIGSFPDLEGEYGYPALNEDTALGYPEGQKLALSLRQKGHSGLLYPSVRHHGGRCLVAFDPGIVQNVRPGATWKLSWNGSESFSICAVQTPDTQEGNHQERD
ncbi:RES domain-containing protein [Cohaesibacter sp. ES.047]|uniref:RES family NAD+ phosphorylase n=1 Tax=Cohaesibacter sp. ES.047 TaxID=1798205 RepID=UPI000BB69E72|nr:RES family NAD+ phosphorylase [Cohaesibacter sp. ES.047]SNY91980.1 RES domain-containing protein [Cohaesibacter sp. ES.047]